MTSAGTRARLDGDLETMDPMETMVKRERLVPAVLLLAMGLVIALASSAITSAGAPAQQAGPAAARAMPYLHHVHLNSVDPDAAIEWYTTVWPAVQRTTVAGFPAIEASMYLLFNEVDEPPPGAWREDIRRAEPQSVFWHIGINIDTTNVDERLEAAGVKLVPLFRTPEDREGIWRSGLSPYPGMRTAAQIEEMQRQELRDGGFGYMLGPDGALVEASGGARTRNSFNHVHMYHEQPLCAARWYRDHLGMEPRRGGLETAGPCEIEYGDPSYPSLETIGTIRTPPSGVRYGNGGMNWYTRQCVRGRCGEDQPLVSSRGQVFDHIAFTYPDLDAQVARLRNEGVTILEEPYPFGDTRAAMIEDLDGLAIELIEASTAARLAARQ